MSLKYQTDDDEQIGSEVAAAPPPIPLPVYTIILIAAILVVAAVQKYRERHW